ncbi:MAG: hypothetical protein CMJ78_00650 [Planctomycetaceae bacterium]|nr:hypothetical protein [Planctomycetaceae bacterium]
MAAFFMELGIKKSTLRAARRAGLPVRYLHRQGFIYGQDWIDYVLNSGSQGQDEPATMTPQLSK